LSVSVPPERKNEITLCLNALLTFGSVGSRSRNGFGSLAAAGELTPAQYPAAWEKSLSVEYPTLNSKSKFFITKQSYDTWEGALSEIGIIYRKARTDLEPKHKFMHRSLVSRPVEVKGELAIPEHVRKERSPKQFILHVGKQNGKYFGQILSLPIIFYEPDMRELYNKVIDDMHNSLSKAMTEKTGEVLNRMGGKP
jgi:CRISPR-associated protein Cmr1